MSERTQVEVLLPLDRPPTQDEKRDLVAIAFDSARKLVSPHGGRVLGLSSSARAETLDGQLAWKFRFVVLVPEKVIDRPKAIAVDRAVGKDAG